MHILIHILIGLFLSVQYFVLRPKGKATFTKWWKRGFYGVLLMVVVMCVTLFCTIVTLTFFLLYIVVPQSQLCLTLEAKYKQGSVVFLSGMLLITTSIIIIIIIVTITIIITNTNTIFITVTITISNRTGNSCFNISSYICCFSTMSRCILLCLSLIV